MKKTILYFFAFLVIGTAFTACNKDTENLTDDAIIKALTLTQGLEEVDVADLPADAQTYLDENQFDTYVEKVMKAPEKGFRCEMGSGDVLFFNEAGRHLVFGENFEFGGPNGHFGPHGPCHRPHRGFGEPLAIEDLSAAITDYITENYPDSEIKRARINQDGEVLVKLMPFTILKFDADGNFIEELTPLHNCHRPCNRLAFDELPAVISEYITTNFPEAEFKVACHRGPRIAVFMRTPEGRLILVFNAETGELLFRRG